MTQFNGTQMFPQPQGSIYMINSSSEISNIPIGNYLSAGICLSEGVLYLKTLQNGVPMMLGYKLSSLENGATPTPQTSEETPKFQDYEKRLTRIEEYLKKSKKGDEINWAI